MASRAVTTHGHLVVVVGQARWLSPQYGRVWVRGRDDVPAGCGHQERAGPGRRRLPQADDPGNAQDSPANIRCRDPPCREPDRRTENGMGR